MSDIRADTISDAAGTGPITLTKQSAAKAWINFNGTGTVAIRDSFSVSSLTDGGVGNYSMNFTNSFASVNGVGAGSFSWSSNGNPIIVNLSSTSVGQIFTLENNVFVDRSVTSGLYMGDLA